MNGPVDLDELFDGWIDLWEFWGPSEHLFRSVNIIEIAYAVVEYDPYKDPYVHGSEKKDGMTTLLRQIIQDKLVRNYGLKPGQESRASAYALGAKLLTYCEAHPREKA